MMIVHESGHVVAALISGGRVQRVMLHPLSFSRTDVSPNPHPLLVAWGGPVFGAALPLLAWAIARALKLPGAYLLRFFAGFCLIANGAYIGVGSFHQIGDTYPMLLFGSSMWQLWLFGVASFPLGLLLWHRLGPSFGLGPNAHSVHATAAYGTLGALAVVIAVELLMKGQFGR
jgi:hypothetical protein